MIRRQLLELRRDLLLGGYSFFVQSNNVIYEYKFKKNMTWAEFVNSRFNDGKFTLFTYGSYTRILFDDDTTEGKLAINGALIVSSGIIEPDAIYLKIEKYIIYDNTIQDKSKWKSGKSPVVLSNGYFDSEFTTNSTDTFYESTSDVVYENAYLCEETTGYQKGISIYLQNINMALYDTIQFSAGANHRTSDSDVYRYFGIVKNSVYPSFVSESSYDAYDERTARYISLDNRVIDVTGINDTNNKLLQEYDAWHWSDDTNKSYYYSTIFLY